MHLLYLKVKHFFSKLFPLKYVIVSQRDQRSATIPLLILQTSEIPSYVLHSALRYTHTLSTTLVLFFLSILLASQFAFRLQLAFSDILPIDLRMFWFLHLDFSFVCYTLVSFLLLLFYYYWHFCFFTLISILVVDTDFWEKKQCKNLGQCMVLARNADWVPASSHTPQEWWPIFLVPCRHRCCCLLAWTTVSRPLACCHRCRCCHWHCCCCKT